jgi:hypothetical protein
MEIAECRKCRLDPLHCKSPLTGGIDLNIPITVTLSIDDYSLVWLTPDADDEIPRQIPTV